MAYQDYQTWRKRIYLNFTSRPYRCRANSFYIGDHLFLFASNAAIYEFSIFYNQIIRDCNEDICPSAPGPRILDHGPGWKQNWVKWAQVVLVCVMSPFLLICLLKLSKAMKSSFQGEEDICHYYHLRFQRVVGVRVISRRFSTQNQQSNNAESCRDQQRDLRS